MKQEKTLTNKMKWSEIEGFKIACLSMLGLIAVCYLLCLYEHHANKNNPYVYLNEGSV